MNPLHLLQPSLTMNNSQNTVNSEEDDKFRFRIRSFFGKFYSNLREVKEKALHDYYKEGIQLILDIDSMEKMDAAEKVQLKQNVMDILLTIFPEKPELYYYMACIYKDVNMDKYIFWLHICLDKDPTYAENVLDIIKTYFNMDQNNIIENLNKKYNGAIFGSQDPRVKLSSATVLLKTHRKKSAKNLMENILYHKFPGDLQIIFYITLIRLYLELSSSDMSIHYINKCIEYCMKTPNIKKEILRTFYDNIMITFDYFYYDQNDRINIYNSFKTVHSSLPYSSRITPELEKKVKRMKDETTLQEMVVSTNTIKIGYVSSDMVNHAVSHFIIPILENHSEKFEVYCFTKNEYINLPKVKKCIPIGDMTTVAAAEKIRELGIDVLIDLNGYTAGNRLDVFEYVPAPIQVTYLGYPNSLCLDYIHYRITDTIADHETSQQKYSEKLVKLPGCFLMFKETFPRNHFRIKKGLNDPIIFGSLNKESKINNSVLNVWSEILRETPNSKILIKLDTIAGEDVDRIQFYTSNLDVDESRIIFVNYMKENIHYMELFKEVDVLLDTFPYSGTTTTCKALYSSVPVVTLYNKDYHSHNVSASILINSNLHELVAYSIEEYKEKVYDLYRNREKLEYYRSGFISEEFDKCMDSEKFMVGYENGILQMYLHAVETRNETRNSSVTGMTDYSLYCGP